MRLPEKLNRIVWSILRLKIGIPVTLFLSLFFAGIVSEIFFGAGERMGVASDLASLEQELSAAGAGPNPVIQALQQKSFIPLQGEIQWRVAYGGRTYTTEVFGTFDIDFPEINPEEIYFTAHLWNKHCEFNSFGLARDLRPKPPDWPPGIPFHPGETAIMVSQRTNPDDQQAMIYEIRYVICLESKQFFASCLSSRDAHK